MFSMPSGVRGPVLVPPWIRHLPLAMAGDPHGVFLRRFLARQRGAALAALSALRQSGTYGLLSGFISTPDAPCDDRLSALTDVDVLDGDGLSAACTELVESEGAFLVGIHHPC